MIKKLLSSAALLGAAILSTPASAAPINAPVPTANFITVGGLDWAWAAPCSFSAPSCGVVDLSYQSTQGWRIPTRAEFIARPTTAQFLGRCASAWFSTQHVHCDFGDPDQGFLDDFGYGLTSNGSSSIADTWLVRGAAVPEPAAWALMIGGFGLAGAALRRRNQTGVAYA